MAELTLKSAKSLYYGLGQTIRMVEADTDQIYRTLKAIESIDKYNLIVLNCLHASLYLNFIYLDFCVAYRLYLSGLTHYEQRFSIKQLYQIMNEGYKRLYGFNNEKGKSILSKTRKESVWNVYLKIYESCGISDVEDAYSALLKYVSSFEDLIIFDKNSRCHSAHYNEDVNALYIFIRDLNAETVTQGATHFMAFMEEWRKFISIVTKSILNQKV